MSILKRVGSLALSLLLVFSSLNSIFAVQALAATSPTLSLESKSVNAGEQFTVAVNLANATSVCGGNFTLQYDSDLLIADSFVFGSIVDGYTKNCNLNYQSTGNLIRLTFSGSSTLATSGTLVTFTFTAKQNISGSAKLQFNAYKMYDENGSSITSTATGSTITIKTESVVSPTLSITSKTVTVGETFSVPIIISNSAAVYGGNFTLQYDSDLLTADSYTFGSIVSGHTKNCNLDYQSAGNLIRVTFSGSEAVSSDGTLVTITFTAQATGTVNLSLNTYKMYDKNGSSINTNISNGNIVVKKSTSEPTLVYISVATKPTKTTYGIDESLNTSGLTLKLTYSDDSTKIVSSGFTTSGFNSATAGTKTVTVSYGGKTTTFTVNVESTTVTFDKDRIDLGSSGSKTATVTATIEGYYAHWQCDWDGAVIGVEKTQNGNKITMVVTARTAGTSQLVLKAQDENYNILAENHIDITVVDDASLSSIEIYQSPTKGHYFIGDSFETSGMQLKLTYSDGTTRVVSDGFEISGFDSSTEGIKKVVINYLGKTTTMSVTVYRPHVDLSAYYISLSEIGETKEITATTVPSGQAISWGSSNPSVATVSNRTITAKSSGTAEISASISYNGIIYTSICNVSVSTSDPEPTLSSISIATKPTKTIYEIGESLNTSGLTLKLTYSDGSTKIVSNGFTTSGFSSTTAGTKNITVTYEGEETSFTVTVNAKSSDLQVTIESKKACAGKTVLVNVSLQNNPGIWGMDLIVNYDKTKLTLISVTNGTVFTDAEWTKGNLSGEKYILSYEAGGLENITKNGVIATLEFAVNENAQTDDFYEVSVSYKSGDIINVGFEEINPTIVSGGIRVINVIYGDLNDDGVVNKKDSLLMKMYLADNTTEIDKEAADVFHDGVINKKDSLYLKQFLAGLDVELGA